MNSENTKVKILQSARRDFAMSVIEMDIAPKTGNPKHFHNLFSETFEVITGALFIGKGRYTTTLHPGQKIKVKRGEVHFFENTTDDVCKIRVTLEPGNDNFEDAMQIYYGLQASGLASASGTPKRLEDLALFLKLNNSRMVGAAKIAQPVFAYIARRAERKGRLAKLRAMYCNGQ